MASYVWSTGNLRDKRPWLTALIASKESGLCWDWAVLPKSMEAKDGAYMGNRQERTSCSFNLYLAHEKCLKWRGNLRNKSNADSQGWGGTICYQPEDVTLPAWRDPQVRGPQNWGTGCESEAPYTSFKHLPDPEITTPAHHSISWPFPLLLTHPFQSWKWEC